MASVRFERVTKVFRDGTRAVVDLSLDIGDGEFMVLVGPSGCGKTTALRMAAGLEDVTEGEISIDSLVVNELEPPERDIAMVFQNYALYPHKTVYDNIAFGLRMQKVPKAEIDRRVREISRALGLEELLARKPSMLSGGQRQRVAMGRAIVREPQAFLMDEPLSNLDAQLRVHMRAEISRLQKALGTTTLYVTHDQVEAMTMGDRVAILRKGRLEQIGAPQTLYDEPANLFVAQFIGSPAMNLVEARVASADGDLFLNIGEEIVRLPAKVVKIRPALAGYIGRSIALGVRPEHIQEWRSEDQLRARLSGRVALTEALGPEQLVHFEVQAEPLMTEEVVQIARDTDPGLLQEVAREAERRSMLVVGRLSADCRLRSGGVLEIGIDLGRAHFFDKESGVAIAAAGVLR